MQQAPASRAKTWKQKEYKIERKGLRRYDGIYKTLTWMT